MPSLANPKVSCAVHVRFQSLHVNAEHTFGLREIDGAKRAQSVVDFKAQAADQSRQFSQNSLDFLSLFAGKGSQLIIQLYYGHGFNKESQAAGRSVMDYPGHCCS